MKKILLLIILACFCTEGSLAAIVQGIVTDEKGEPLPFATVSIAGTTLGTSCNAEGKYMLTIPAGTHTVQCQYMGFEKAVTTLSFQDNAMVTHNFRLKEQTLSMKEYVVKASEDPAMYIMRKVIAKRKFHQKQIETFETGIYLKGILRTREMPDKIMGTKIDPTEITGIDSTGKGILYLCEEEGTFYTQQGKQRTVIHAVRESGNPNGLGMSSFPPVVNFYDNNVNLSEDISPRGLISPVSENALYYYNYKLLGDFQESGKTIYKIAVSPKRDYEPLFRGDIYIVDEQWCFHSLDLYATQKSNINFLDTLQFRQYYIPLQEDLWIIKQQVLLPKIKVLGFDIVGSFVTVYNNQKVNQRMPDTLFNAKILSVYDENANKKDSSYWMGSRPIPLEDDEVRDFLLRDSVHRVTSDPKYIDSMRRIGNKISVMDLITNGISHTGKDKKYFFSTNALLSGLANYNIVEGVNIAPRIEGYYHLDTFHQIKFAAAARYGFSNLHFNAIGRVSYVKKDKYWSGRYWELGLEGGQYVFQFNPYNPIQPLYNTITTLFYRKNYLKIYERAGGKLSFKRSYGNGFAWSAYASLQRRTYVSNTTDFSFAKTNVGGFTPNYPPELAWVPMDIHNAAIVGGKLSWQPGYTYTLYPNKKVPNGSRYPVFSLAYEKGLPGIMDSKTDFDKWEADMKGYIGLRLAGIVEYKLRTGGFLNNKYVSIPDLNHIQGNQLIVATPYLESFQTAPYYLYSNQEPWFGAAHVEWKLNGFLTNKIPLFRRLSWYLLTGANLYYVNDKFYHTEAFVGLDNIGYGVFRLLRVDVVQSWNSIQTFNTAVRIGLRFGDINAGAKDW